MHILLIKNCFHFTIKRKGITLLTTEDLLRMTYYDMTNNKKPPAQTRGQKENDLQHKRFAGRLFNHYSALLLLLILFLYKDECQLLPLCIHVHKCPETQNQYQEYDDYKIFISLG